MVNQGTEFEERF